MGESFLDIFQAVTKRKMRITMSMFAMIFLIFSIMQVDGNKKIYKKINSLENHLLDIKAMINGKELCPPPNVVPDGGCPPKMPFCNGKCIFDFNEQEWECKGTCSAL